MTTPADPEVSTGLGPFVTRSGSGRLLLLLHATLSSSAELEALSRRLSSTFRVVRVDRRGSGRSRPAPGAALDPIDVAVHVADLADIVAAEGGGPAFVVGHSYGGCLALELAARQPARVAAVWAYEPPYALVGPPEVRAALGRIGRSTMDAYRAAGAEAAAEAFLAGVAGPHALEGLSPGSRARIRSQGPAAIADATLLGLDSVGLGGIGCPVRLVTGTASRRAYAAIAADLTTRISGAVHEQLADADHMAPVTRPADVAASIRALASS